ncbi:MAG: Trk system potassium transporter TrkA, partial [Verrucomicrobiales bacterium]
MNIIIIGAGQIGLHLARSLSGAAHDIVVIESNEKLADSCSNEIDGRVIHGSGTSVELLLDAGVSEADLIFALTSHDATNLVACEISKRLGTKKAICRVSPQLVREEWIFDYRGNFSLDHIFSSERLSAIEISKHIRNPDGIAIQEIARGRIEIQQVRIPDHSTACGKSLIELNLPERVRVAAIQRAEKSFIPTAEEIIQANDQITLFGDPSKLSKTASTLRSKNEKEKSTNIVILGGGEYGVSLAQMISSWGCQIRIFEKDQDLAEQLAEELAGTATVIHADATSLNELREEQIGEADFFISTTQSDEDNVMTCLQAHNLGTKNCLPLIHRTDYANSVNQSKNKLGIKEAIIPRETVRRELMRFITS